MCKFRRVLPCVGVMAGEATCSGTATVPNKKKGKFSRQESGISTEFEVDKPGTVTTSQTTRGGLRVYKIVVLGDGGVGKSGNFKSESKI